MWLPVDCEENEETTANATLSASLFALGKAKVGLSAKDAPVSLNDSFAPYGTKAQAIFAMPGSKRPAAEAPAEPVEPAPARLAGMDALLDPSGALYWPAEETLIVSDLHLETGSSYARTGQMLPPYDTGITLARLLEAISRYTPRRIVSLGDSFHDPFGAERLQPADRAVLTRLAAAHELIWVSGNHDKGNTDGLDGHSVDELTLADVTFRHIPSETVPSTPEVAGHLHPAARLALRGRTLRRRCFIGCAQRLVMPAFGCLTGGLSIADPAFGALWASGRPNVHVLGRARVYSI